MLHWINQFTICSFLDTHQYTSHYSNIKCLAAVGSIKEFRGTDALHQIDEFYQQEPDWLFGHIAYEKDNDVAVNNTIGFSPMFFYQPAIVLQLSSTELVIASATLSPTIIFEQILSIKPNIPTIPTIQIKPRISKERYLQTIKQLLAHIVRGDCYEINFCQEFYAEQVNVHPVNLYQALTTISPNPFSCYYKENNAHLACASPERYLQKKGGILLTQPIKGTSKRNQENPALDAAFKLQLKESSKDRSENVMVVDLVRNDLSKVCKEGTVQVEELFGIYSFPQVHQMISTITGELKKDTGFKNIIEASFPMGSMTGAPKKRVMELIAKYEPVPRGIFSGAVGYITPEMDFDFNVVIRSLLYNANTHYLSYLVGSGITFYSNPQEEYEECLLKAKAMETILGH